MEKLCRLEHIPTGGRSGKGGGEGEGGGGGGGGGGELMT